MNRLELAGVVLIAAVCAFLGLWLILSRVWGRGRIPERLIAWEPGPDWEPGGTIAVDGDPRRVHITRRGMAVINGDAVVAASPLTGADRFLPVWARDGEIDFEAGFDEAQRRRPPCSEAPFDHSPARPWAHGDA